MLDNFPHIKAFWMMITPPVAQTAQWYGADDIDGGGGNPSSLANTVQWLCSN